MAAASQPAFGLLPAMMPLHQEEAMAAPPDQLLGVLLCTVQGSLQVQHFTETCSYRAPTKATACAYPNSMLAGSMPL